MDRDGLQAVRRWVPGILCFVTLSSLIFPDYTPFRALQDLSATVTFSLGALAVFVLFLGVSYRQMDLQNKVHNFTWRNATDDHLKVRLLDLLEPGELDQAQKQRLRTGMTLIQSFYNVVDNDSSLRNKVSGVYESGAYLGSAADVAFFALVGTAAHLLLTLVSHRPWVSAWLIIFGLGFLLAVVFLFLGIPRHMRLTDDQFDYIRVNLANDVKARLRALASSANGGH